MVLKSSSLLSLSQPRTTGEDSVEIAHTLGGNTRTGGQKLAGIRGWLARYDRHFEYAASVVVGLHVILLLVELELERASSALALDLSDWPAVAENPWRYQLRVLDVVFDFYFLLDLSLRMFVQRCSFCKSSMNCFEACLTAGSLADLVIIANAGGLAHPADATVLHLIRAAASLRLIRFCKFVEGVHMLLKACTSFLPSLCWSMVLLTIFMLVGALTIGNLIQDYITNPQVNREDRIWLWQHYGTAQRSLYTIYEITFAGNWPVNVRPVLSGANRAFAFFFVAYVTIIVSRHEGTALFHILDNGDGEVTREEFIDGILRCKGPARAIDQLVMHAELKQLESKIAQFIRTLGSAKIAGQLNSNRGTSSSSSPTTSFLRFFRRFVSNYSSDPKLATWRRRGEHTSTVSKNPPRNSMVGASEL
ncbi:scn4aa [Symbiodinium necroappetens]|uniref:Scn4aa protein n=1 Tax=Symbiodinium necroappetens TaxID=1628268 RepID=A0A813BKX6_9DINO|nr:scn4aa [Symbiodinium necroappetens]